MHKLIFKALVDFLTMIYSSHEKVLLRIFIKYLLKSCGSEKMNKCDSEKIKKKFMWRLLEVESVFLVEFLDCM